MSLRVVVAAPFRDAGRDRIGEQAFVVALSLDRDWVSPDQAKRVIERAADRDLVDREDGDVVAQFPVDEVEIPADFEPDSSLFRDRPVFERVLDALVEAEMDRRSAVAAINETQQTLDVTANVAAVLTARAEGVDVEDRAKDARESLVG
ncbi:MAG: DUF2240 family protein [Halanaeroarchaeum sp.]